MRSEVPVERLSHWYDHRELRYDDQDRLLCESLNVVRFPWKGDFDVGFPDCRDPATRTFEWSNGDRMNLCEDHYAEFMETR